MDYKTTNESILDCIKKKSSFYIAQYPVRWTAQSAPAITLEAPFIKTKTFLFWTRLHASMTVKERQEDKAHNGSMILNYGQKAHSLNNVVE